MDRRLSEKYFNYLTNQGETQKVLELFRTDEGMKYLHERLEEDRHLMNRDDLSSDVAGLDSEKLYKSIQSEINDNKSNVFFKKKTDWLGYAVKAAATVLVVLTATIFTLTHEWNSGDQAVEREPLIYQTAEDQHREITFADGSVVRLNKNSEIMISENYMLGSREINLTGEVYFDVAHNQEKLIIIHTGHSSIEGDLPEQPSIILSRGKYGYLDLNERYIKVDEVAIENYLAWKSGRFVIEDLTMQQVCSQLNRIYSVHCYFKDSDIRSLNLTTNFTNESLEKTLDVIFHDVRSQI